MYAIRSYYDPFKLFKTLDESKSPAPVKGGSVAPCDIEVKAGSTGMPPGPFLSELKAVGIPAAIDKGKIGIKEDKVVIKEGEVVSQKLAVVLSALGIKPRITSYNVCYTKLLRKSEKNLDMIHLRVFQTPLKKYLELDILEFLLMILL